VSMRKKYANMPKLRSANLLAALAGQITQLLEGHGKIHPNANNSTLAALNLIGFYDGCSNVELSRALRLSHTATVRLVDKLEASKLVVVRRGTDKRSVAMSLTDTGRERVKEVLRVRCLLLADLIEALTPEQTRSLDAITETLLKSMVTAVGDGDHICRLCDQTACPEEACPVHQKAVAVEGG
jgi:MarR family transcriptional repressor of emrRAB